MKHPKIDCNMCGRKVRDCFQSKWEHVLQYHPQVPLNRLIHLLINPDEVERFGEWIGNRLRHALQLKG